MIGARRACALLLLLFSFALLSRAALAEEEARGGDETMVSPEGRRFRVRFDPASRIWLGTSYAMGLGDGGVGHASEIDAGLSYRGRYESGAGARRVVWQIDQRVLAGWVTPFTRPLWGVPALDATLYAASLHRHDESPSVVLPMSPPVSIPFPFDVAFEGEAGRVWIPPAPPRAAEGGAPVPMIRVGVLRASVLLDPWRSGAPGRSLEIGAGVRYDVDAYDTGLPARAAPASEAAPAVIHRVAPMTATSARLRIQSGDGLTALDCRGDFIPHWTSEGRWRVMVLSAARVERTVAAINDEPIVLALDGGYRLLPPGGEVAALHDVRVSLGLTFNLQL